MVRRCLRQPKNLKNAKQKHKETKEYNSKHRRLFKFSWFGDFTWLQKDNSSNSSNTLYCHVCGKFLQSADTTSALYVWQVNISCGQVENEAQLVRGQVAKIQISTPLRKSRRTTPLSYQHHPLQSIQQTMDITQFLHSLQILRAAIPASYVPTWAPNWQCIFQPWMHKCFTRTLLSPSSSSWNVLVQ